VAEEGFRALGAATEAAAARHRDQPLAKLLQISVAYLRFAVAHVGHYRVMFGPIVLDKSLYPGLRAVGTAAFDYLTDAVADCQRAGVLRDGDPRAAAMAIWTLGHGLAALAVDRQIPPPVLAMVPLDRLAEGLTQMLLDGLRLPPARGASR